MTFGGSLFSGDLALLRRARERAAAGEQAGQTTKQAEHADRRPKARRRADAASTRRDMLPLKTVPCARA